MTSKWATRWGLSTNQTRFYTSQMVGTRISEPSTAVCSFGFLWGTKNQRHTLKSRNHFAAHKWSQNCGFGNVTPLKIIYIITIYSIHVLYCSCLILTSVFFNHAFSSQGDPNDGVREALIGYSLDRNQLVVLRGICHGWSTNPPDHVPPQK